MILGVIGRKNGLYQTIVQYAQKGERVFIVQYGENTGAILCNMTNQKSWNFLLDL